MSYGSEIVKALGMAAPAGAAPTAAQSAWTRLREFLTAWRQMHGVSHQRMGSGPSVSMFEDKLTQMVAIDLRVYQNALAAAGNPQEEPAPVEGPWSRTVFLPSSPAATGAATDPPEIPCYVEEVMGGSSLARLAAGQKLNLHAVERDIPSYDETRVNILGKIALALGLPAPCCSGCSRAASEAPAPPSGSR